jgi:hypothetical protein
MDMHTANGMSVHMLDAMRKLTLEQLELVSRSFYHFQVFEDLIDFEICKALLAQCVEHDTIGVLADNGKGGFEYRSAEAMLDSHKSLINDFEELYDKVEALEKRADFFRHEKDELENGVAFEFDCYTQHEEEYQQSLSNDQIDYHREQFLHDLLTA